MANIKNEAVDN